MILTDNETKVDLLNYEAIAATIIKILRSRPDRPVTIGVHGDWGAGKSSILEMIEAGLENRDRVLCLKFNGWRFQGFEDAKIALIEGIVTGLLEKRPKLTKASAAVKDILRRIDWLKVAKRAGGLAFTAVAATHTLSDIHSAIGMLEGLPSNPVLTKENVETALDDIKSLVKPEAETTNVPAEIGAFRRAFDKLLEAAKVDQLVVLIDDLDRCLPDTAIETLEAVRLFVFTLRTAFVVAADEAMIEYAVRRHFPDLPDSTGPQTYARNYLEKLIQVPFRIPALGETETRIYVTLLLVGAEIGEDHAAFEQLIAAARERLKRPWIGGVIDAGTLRAALGEATPRALPALTLSDQIGPLLASGSRGNPRQIKRFLNTLLLRMGTAEARGFGDDVRLPTLAKLMLADRFIPRLFDQVATAAAASPRGTCDDLAVLEAAAVEQRKPRVVPKAAPSRAGGEGGERLPTVDVAKTTQSAQLVEWLASPSIRAWAELQPPLAGTDLRPYLFVTKDRKNYFGALSVLGPLAAVAEKLFAPKILLQTEEMDLKRLTTTEATQVFEEVRSRILGTDTFESAPPGVDGLSILVKAHQHLQTALLDFLQGLPRNRLGPWVVTGWEGAIKDPDAVTRFDGLLRDWTTGEAGAFLKTAAEGVLRMRQRTR